MSQFRYDGETYDFDGTFTMKELWTIQEFTGLTRTQVMDALNYSETCTKHNPCEDHPGKAVKACEVCQAPNEAQGDCERCTLAAEVKKFTDEQKVKAEVSQAKAMVALLWMCRTRAGEKLPISECDMDPDLFEVLDEPDPT